MRLCDVTEKGKSFNLSDGIVRLAPGVGRAGTRTASARLDIAMWPTANTFQAGHRIRLQVSSGAHPLFYRNAGTGEPLATGANLRSADQEIFHDARARRPSRCTSCRCCRTAPLGRGRRNGFARHPRLTSRA